MLLLALPALRAIPPAQIHILFACVARRWLGMDGAMTRHGIELPLVYGTRQHPWHTPNNTVLAADAPGDLHAGAAGSWAGAAGLWRPASAAARPMPARSCLC